MIGNINHKFKVGDRVVYNAVAAGNTALDGKVGMVIYVDNTRCPYTVEFDDFYDIYSGIPDHRVTGADPYHGWFCREENLTLLEVPV